MKRLVIVLSFFVFLVFGSVRAKIIGDFNDDGKINIFDLLVLLQHLSGRDTDSDIGKEYLLAIDTISIHGILLVSIPGGSFQMGSDEGFDDEKPVHTVSLDAFQMSIYEITQAQYQDVIGSNPSVYTGDDNLPVELVTWYDAVTFCNNLSEAAGLEPCYNLSTWSCDFWNSGFRLPTEAEWEYACRAGTTTKFYTGDSENALGRAGWYGGSSGNSGRVPHPVGQKEANAFGLYDMHGNVWEFCNDFYDDNYYSISPIQNPTGPESGENCVVRSGAWGESPIHCRSAKRSYQELSPNGKNYCLGFRIVRR